jgi:hypothetical protein
MTEFLFLHWQHLSRAERIALVLLFATLTAWIWIPTTAQDQSYHAFADTRALFGVPRAADVLSNLAFAAVGLFGIRLLVSTGDAKLPTRGPCEPVVHRASGFSPPAPAPPGITSTRTTRRSRGDRLPMTLVFSGVLGLAAAQRIGQNVARVALALLFELGVASVVYWRITGDLSLYLALQYGGFAALVVLLLATRQRDDPFPWWWLVGWYGLAKVFEGADAMIWNATHGLIAGHVLKHLAAAAGGPRDLPAAARKAGSHGQVGSYAVRLHVGALPRLDHLAA